MAKSKDALQAKSEKSEITAAIAAETAAGKMESYPRERLDFLRAKGPLSEMEQAQLDHLKLMHADERVAMSDMDQNRLAYLLEKGPRSAEENDELAKLEAGPFTLEQWRHLTSYIELAVMHRHSHGGRVPVGYHP